MWCVVGILLLLLMLMLSGLAIRISFNPTFGKPGLTQQQVSDLAFLKRFDDPQNNSELRLLPQSWRPRLAARQGAPTPLTVAPPGSTGVTELRLFAADPARLFRAAAGQGAESNNQELDGWVRDLLRDVRLTASQAIRDLPQRTPGSTPIALVGELRDAGIWWAPGHYPAVYAAQMTVLTLTYQCAHPSARTQLQALARDMEGVFVESGMHDAFEIAAGRELARQIWAATRRPASLGHCRPT